MPRLEENLIGVSPDERKIRDEIYWLIKKYYQTKANRRTETRKIPLSAPSYSSDEVNEALDSMLEGRVTMGEKVRAFEQNFAKYLGADNAIMVNSGSSANLLALSLLSNPATRNPIKPKDEVITPALTWSTTVYPIIGTGAIPVFVDINPETLTIDPQQVEQALSKRTRALFIVHLLGSPCDMKAIAEIAERHDLFLLEDSCEALGAEVGGVKVGTFGDIATFSFYFSHHITTIEGGMVVAKHDELSDLSRVMRAHGWIRDFSHSQETAKAYPDIDPRFLFVNFGYNVRPTEIQGAFGLHQLRKLDRFLSIRRENAAYWSSRLERYQDVFAIHKERPGTKHAWFSYPIILKPTAPFARAELMSFLQENGIETRPVMSGNMTRQPAMKLFDYKTRGTLRVADRIMSGAFLIGNHQDIGKEEREYVANVIESFVEKRAA